MTRVDTVESTDSGQTIRMAGCWLAEFSCIAWPWVKPTTEECSCDRGLLGCIHQAVLRGTWADVASNEKFFMEPLQNTALQMKNLTVARYNLAKFPALVNMLCPSSSNPGRHALRFRNTHWHGHAQQFGEVGNQSRPNLNFFFPSLSVSGEVNAVTLCDFQDLRKGHSHWLWNQRREIVFNGGEWPQAYLKNPWQSQSTALLIKRLLLPLPQSATPSSQTVGPFLSSW